MKAFAELYAAIDESNKTNDKVAALVAYFKKVPAADAAWAVYFLIGRKPKRVISARQLAKWAAELRGIPEWLFDESYHAVGDIAETVTLLLPASDRMSELPLDFWIRERLLALPDLSDDAKKDLIIASWLEMDRGQRFVWNKLITGGFRVGVSQQLVIRALADVSENEKSAIAHRLMGNWQPNATFFEGLLKKSEDASDQSRPYPFFLAHPLEKAPDELGDIQDWQAEWKWDGIRAQLIYRSGEVFFWSRGEELVTDKYPEIAEAALALPNGTVMDGELLPWRDGEVLPFALLQKRIGRKNVSKKILQEVPVILMAYDLLESQSNDLRERPLQQRRQDLEQLIAEAGHPKLMTSPIVHAASWQELAKLQQKSRERQVEGLMLKKKDSPYRVGRQRGDWWKWKVEPYTVDAVLVYAQRGSGKRASLYTDYTFAIWDGNELVPFAKAYSGLTDAEIREVDSFVRKNTNDRFGPVRTVKPELVFELGFEGIQRSTRHKSGIAVRFPRMLRWRKDKSAEEADTLENVKRLLPQQTEEPPPNELF